MSRRYDFALAPGRKATLRNVGREREPVLVIDDVLADPASLVEYASWEVAFMPAGHAEGGYPGVRAPAPLPYVEQLVRALDPSVREAFGLEGVKLANAECTFSLATLPPSELTIEQRVPHVDTTYPLQFAWLHYLCGPEHGGTSFYRHRATGFEALSVSRQPAYDAVRGRELAQAAPAQAYVGDDSAEFERIGGCEAAFNRLVIYRSCLLHSIHVAAGATLAADPRRGRLTANVFVNYRPV